MASYTGPFTNANTAPLPPGKNNEFDLVESDYAILDHYVVTSNAALISGANLFGSAALLVGSTVTIALYDNSTSVGIPIWTSSTMVVGAAPYEAQRLTRNKIGLYALVTGATSFAFQIGARVA
jgi:energy-converting hydrogenase Eha subunit H